jgi:hypothetical protein
MFMDLLNDKIWCLRSLLSSLIEMYGDEDVTVLDQGKYVKIYILSELFTGMSPRERQKEVEVAYKKLPLHLWYDDVVSVLLAPQEQTNLFNNPATSTYLN